MTDMLRRLERAFTRGNEALIVAMMMSMAGLVFANVVTRYLFDFSLNWAEEVSRFLMIWVTYLGAGLAMREGRHVAIEFVQERLPKRLVPFVRAAVGLAVLSFLGVLTYLGIDMARFAWDQTTPVLGISQGIPYLAIPLGAALFGMHLLIIARDYLRQQPNAIDQAAETDDAPTTSEADATGREEVHT